jgi:hypothetical protein
MYFNFRMPPKKVVGRPVLSKATKPKVQSYSVQYTGSQNNVKLTKLQSSQPSSSAPLVPSEHIAFVEHVVEEQWNDDISAAPVGNSDDPALPDEILQLESLLDDAQDVFTSHPSRGMVRVSTRRMLFPNTRLAGAKRDVAKLD